MDMWSIGCVLYELFTGRILFPGRTNNDMLRVMMEVKGPFPRKMLKKGIFVDKHFEDDANMSFALVEEDPVTKQPVGWVDGGRGARQSGGAGLRGPRTARAARRRRAPRARRA
jgi:serine/threonine protein kinase